MAIEIIHVVGQANNNGNPKPDSGGRHINRTLGEENRLELLVRQTTTEIQSPTPAGGILIDHWARKIVHGFWSGDQQRRRKIIHSCWSGDPPEADKSNNGGDFLVPDYYKEYRGSICINLCKKLVSLITIVISFNSFIKFLL